MDLLTKMQEVYQEVLGLKLECEGLKNTNDELAASIRLALAFMKRGEYTSYALSASVRYQLEKALEDYELGNRPSSQTKEKIDVKN